MRSVRKYTGEAFLSGMENAREKGKHIGRPQTTKDDIPAVFYKHYPAFSAGKMKTLNIGFNAEIEVAAPEVWSLVTSPTQITNGTYVFVAKQKNGTTISYLPNTTASAKNVLQVNTTLFDLTTSVLESIVVPADARWTFP